ncbi:pyridoxal phosphate-dependent aminotransferase family protein [bacterium]|nr:pyridoxal phosphate-dependent aminotransferase family protein [bacterium]
MKGDLFQKCFDFTEAEKVRQLGLYPYFTEISSAQETEVIIDGKKVIMLGSNSYLGLTYHPKVRQGAIDAIEKYGTGCAGSRFLNGTLDLHRELEEKLAEFLHKDAALLFSTGFQTNLGVIAGITNKDDFIIADKLDHASIVDGCKLSYAKTFRFNHNNPEDLEKKLQQVPEGRGKLIVVDGVFSMEGDIAPLDKIIPLKKKYGARILVDDAHSVGVLGDNGRGTSEYFGVENDVDIIMNTFSKSFASLGGYVAASNEVIEYLKHFSRPLIFSASLPPSVLGSVSAALDILKSEPWRRKRLWEITEYMRKGFNDMGFHTGDSVTPIIPVRIGDMMTTFKMRKMLLENGVFVNPVVPPAVSPTDCLIRTSFMATHTNDQLDYVLDKFNNIGKKLGVI